MYSFFLSFFFKAWKSVLWWKVEASESSQTEVFNSYSCTLKWLYSCSQPHPHPHPPLPPCLSEYVCHLSCCANTVVYSFTKLEHDPDCWRPFCHCLYLFISLCFHFSGTTAQTLVPILSPSLTMTQTTGGCSVIACTFSFHCVSISVGLLHKHCGLFFFFFTKPECDLDSCRPFRNFFYIFMSYFHCSGATAPTLWSTPSPNPTVQSTASSSGTPKTTRSVNAFPVGIGISECSRAGT